MRRIYLSLVTGFLLLAGSIFVAQAQSTPVHNPSLVGSYYGYQTSNSNPWLNHWMVLDITWQGPFDDTGNGTHNPWAHISGTLNFLFGGGSYAFTGTVRAGGRVDLTTTAGLSSTTYTSYVQDVGDVGTGPIYYLPGTYVTTRTYFWYNLYTHTWGSWQVQTDAGTFAVDADSQDD